MNIIEVASERGKICEELLRLLPQWFGIESALQHYVREVESMPTFVAMMGEKKIGFISLHLHNKWTAEIHVMAVHPDHHRQGVGRALLEFCQNYLRERNFEFLSVKTLSPSRPHREYDLTRRFYLGMEFRPVEEFKELWGSHNPCLMLIKSLALPRAPHLN